MASKKTSIPLQTDHYYHIFNRSNNPEIIFRSDADYRFFLRKFNEIIVPVMDVLSYCLIPNHFHILGKTKSQSELIWNPDLSEYFRRFFIVYAQVYNNKYDRVGNLFNKPFKRIEISDDLYLKHVIFYIHNNPAKHGIQQDFWNYPYSSLTHILNGTDSIIKLQNPLTWFENDMDVFKEFHSLIPVIPFRIPSHIN